MKYTLFALQVFLPLDASARLRGELHALVRGTSTGATYEEKRQFYGRLANTFAPWESSFVYGVWDYLEDTSRAESEYQTWCRGTVDDAKSALEASSAANAYRQSAGPRYMFATMLFLLRRGGTSDRFVCETCRMPEGEFFTKKTVARLVQALPQLNFPSIRADAVFVRPGSEQLGVSQEELAEEHYSYLRKLV